MPTPITPPMTSMTALRRPMAARRPSRVKAESVMRGAVWRQPES
jgi:hypothetical protein